MMDFFTSNSIKILAQGHTEQPGLFKDIEFDLPLLERERTDGEGRQENPDNAGRSNGLTPLLCYALQEIPSIYVTKAFKQHKISEIVSVSGYLIKVASMVEMIYNGLLDISKGTQADRNLGPYESEEQREFMRSKSVVSDSFSLLWEILISASDLRTDANNIGIETIVGETKSYIHLTLSAHYVPDEISRKINTIFPTINVSRLSQLELPARKNDMARVYKDFLDMEKLLHKIISFFLKSLIDQFSYYVTPEAVLHNPVKRALFVIPMSIYRKFDFQNSGLYRSEVVKFDGEDPETVTGENLYFFASVKKAFNEIYEESTKMLRDINSLPDSFDANEFIRLYQKKHTIEKMDKVKLLFESPAMLEKTTEMLLETRREMVRSATNGDDPWFIVGSHKLKEMDNDTIHFLLKLYELYPGKVSRFPQAQFMRLLNMFSYSRQQVKCMNRHVTNYRNKRHKTSNQYDSVFASILRR